MVQDFLLEIGTEPLPARFIGPAAEQLERGLRQAVERYSLQTPSTSYKTFATLRRLTVLASALGESSPARTSRVKGPPKKLLKDASGAFTLQAAGFARKQGVKPEDLDIEGEFLYANVHAPGEKTTVILARIVPELLRVLEFPKSLEWEPSRFKFGRPIRSITALFGAKVVPIEIAGVKSGKKIRGLAALEQKPIALKAPSDYAESLRTGGVLCDVGERRAELLARLKAAAVEAAGALDLDEELVAETVYMTEQPTPVVGRFSEEFLDLPAALLALVLKKQLKFFPVQDGARLKAAFVGVRDGLPEGQDLVREGYQRVLAARGNDAVFFFRRDLASRLEAKLPLLGRLAYQKGLGSMADKSARVLALTKRLCEMVRQDRPADEAAAATIARLCYADLVTEVVKEFPELQGVMGGVYARRDGLDERVALGLEQFYLPVGPKSPVPTTIEGALVSLGGKLDSLAGNFSIGQAPTGSADPFALRRQALGAIRILLEHQLPIDLNWALRAAIEAQPGARSEAQRDLILGDLRDFIWARAQSFFEEKGFRADEIRSVHQGGLSSLKRTFLRLAAIHSVRQNPDFEPLAAAFKRAANILKQARFPLEEPFLPERGLLKEDAELSLFDALSAMEGQVQERLAAESYEAGLRALVGIKPRLDLFFEKVMVMAEEEGLRRQRLGLLARLARLFNCVADLSEIQSR